jgi:hypothetical protein
MKKFFFLCFLLSGSIAFAQLPESRIYLMDMSKNTDGSIAVLNPRIISFEKGYNNQPYFSEDENTIFFTSNAGSGLTDIYKYNIKRKRKKRFTKTKLEAEYSPQNNLGEDGEISCVRVEKDTVTQLFYSYYKKGKRGRFVLPDNKVIGYYAWLNAAEIIAFNLPEPFTLVKYNVLTLKADTLTTNVGRSFCVNSGKLYFVDKSDSTDWKIKLMAKENLRPRKGDENVYQDSTIVSTLFESEDFCMTPDGNMWMGSGSVLYVCPTKKNKLYPQNKWTAVADLTQMGVPPFYRLTINKESNKLAVVCYEGKKP